MGERFRGPLIGVAFGLLAGGCVEQAPSTTLTPATHHDRFDPAATGNVSGRVSWAGELPEVPQLVVWKLLAPQGNGRFVYANPNAPLVHPQQRGVGSAVVFLRGVDARAARPWDLPAVRVEIGSNGIRVRQGEVAGRMGFVRRGAAVEMLSTEDEFHALRAGGAAFFTVPFPDPDRPLSRNLNRSGLVELTSGVGHYWMRGHLFVDDHPYYARTDAEGNFALSQVPAGRYEVVCWAPNWNAVGHERDPETSRISRLTFHKPAEKVQTVEVRAGETAEVRFELSHADFPR